MAPDSAVSVRAEQLAELLKRARNAVVLTGAGVSVPSGIPDFRTPGTGLWEKVDPMEVAHIESWRRDPQRFWSFYGDRFVSLVRKQ
ncbi:MAG TPA: Sir2 family NAD-dependent protein deacetylase, partial [Thermoleophilaceae bacterium]|nr:Sir2 family NAD-dependent protein deacetylase [Thermoleophilaceae bacterium]